MQQLAYAIQFKGKAEPDGSTGKLRVEAEASSSSITTVVNDGGLTGGFDPAAVAPVFFESTVTMTEGGKFHEQGSIRFGEGGHRLFFKSKDPGWMGESPVSGTTQGAVVWIVDGGEGQLVGAQGIITSNFTVDGQGVVSDHQLGIIYIR